ncbi:MAG: hypothetical protein Q8R28_20350 [Dehalococcoidia bacterium]|nr:hypothetical protein [Dehalococcoidia bacterium]
MRFDDSLANHYYASTLCRMTSNIVILRRRGLSLSVEARPVSAPE